jgi:ABC-type transport system involved in multi-copper enzyme maturation permease subunit
MGSSLVLNEIENRTLYMILSRSVSKNTFMMGKIIGFSFVLVTNVFILSAITMALFLHYGGAATMDIFFVIFFVLAESILLFLIALTFSMFSGKVLTIMSTLTLWVCGHSVGVIKDMSLVKNNPLYSKVVKFYSIYMPNFDKINLKRHILEANYFDYAHYGYLIFYSLLWFVILCTFSSYLFSKKELN